MRISIDARTIAGGPFPSAAAHIVEIIAHDEPEGRGLRPEPRVLVRKHACATEPDKSPTLQRVAELAIEELEDATKQARAIMTAHHFLDEK